MTDLTSSSSPSGLAPLVSGLEPPRSTPWPIEHRVRSSSLIVLAVEHSMLIICAGILFAATAVALLLASSRKFEASVTVAPITTSRQLNLPGGLAGSLLGGMTGGGLQATPVFVARLARLDGVLTDVALADIPADSSRVIERLLKTPLSSIAPHKLAREINDVLQASIDRESGTVTFAIALHDSALARTAINALVSAVRRTYARTNKAQAAELREAQLTRVDSAKRALNNAQSAAVAFAAANRVVPQYSSLWVQAQRLANDLQIAQSIYTSAVSDLSAAEGKQLEDPPALVILDSVPSTLPPRGRGMVSKAVLAGMLGLLIGFGFVVIREAATNASRSADAEAQRLLLAISRLPIVGRWLVRLLVRPRPQAEVALG